MTMTEATTRKAQALAAQAKLDATKATSTNTVGQLTTVTQLGATVPISVKSTTISPASLNSLLDTASHLHLTPKAASRLACSGIDGNTARPSIIAVVEVRSGIYKPCMLVGMEAGQVLVQYQTPNGLETRRIGGTYIFDKAVIQFGTTIGKGQAWRRKLAKNMAVMADAASPDIVE